MMDWERLDLREPNEERRKEVKRTERLLYQYNNLDPDSEELPQVLRELFPDMGENVRTGRPIYCNIAKNIHFGNHIFVNAYFKAMSGGDVYIEDHVRIAFGVTIITNNHDFYDRDILNIKPVRIQENAWIGANATILPGVTIGKNAVVGAASVVTHDVPENAVVAGNPARIIRMLDGSEFHQEVKEDMIPLYELKNGTIAKDEKQNIWLVLKNKDKCLLATKDSYNEVVNPEGSEKIFILGDGIRTLNLGISLEKASDYKIGVYTSSYYFMYSGVSRYTEDTYTVCTDDEDKIIVKFEDNNVKFKRVFDYEFDKIDSMMKDL